MYNADTELMFPMRVAESLKDARGELWAQLVENVSNDFADIRDQSAFVLMMVKLGGCVACNSDSFRAMRGCTQCARLTVRRYRGSDEDLIEQFAQYRGDVENHFRKS